MYGGVVYKQLNTSPLKIKRIKMIKEIINRMAVIAGLDDLEDKNIETARGISEKTWNSYKYNQKRHYVKEHPDSIYALDPKYGFAKVSADIGKKILDAKKELKRVNSKLLTINYNAMYRKLTPSQQKKKKELLAQKRDLLDIIKSNAPAKQTRNKKPKKILPTDSWGSSSNPMVRAFKGVDFDKLKTLYKNWVSGKKRSGESLNAYINSHFDKKGERWNCCPQGRGDYGEDTGYYPVEDFFGHVLRKYHCDMPVPTEPFDDEDDFRYYRDEYDDPDWFASNIDDLEKALEKEFNKG